MPPQLRTKAESVQREDLSQMIPPKRPLCVCDSLHGHIEFPLAIGILIDSPIVQRLRGLKQLGNTFYIYPGATHSRFEHSLGVSYLGMELYRSIVSHHKVECRDFGVPEIACMSPEEVQKDMHCIGIAGLCHDLGHGPLSHLFESFVRSSAERGEDELRSWSHEKASIMLLRRLWSEKEGELTKLGFTEADREYVMLLIRGLAPGEAWPGNVGRKKWARFTTEIIANKRNGLDVDKLDYIQRDSLACFGKLMCSTTQRLFQAARVVVNGRGETSIGYPDKLDGDIEEIFLARSRLHRTVYQHRVTKVLDLMTRDALRAAGDVLQVSDGNGSVMPLRSCVLNADFYVHTGDWIVMALLHSNSSQLIGALDDGALSRRHREKLAEARRILHRITNRQLYPTIGTYRHSEQTSINSARPNSQEGLNQELKPEDMIIGMSEDMARSCAGLKRKLEAWQDQHDGLQAIEILEAEITQTAGDMDKRQLPVKATYFFNPRQSTHCAVEPHFSCNTTTALYVNPAPVTSLTMVCRVPLTSMEIESLRMSFAAVASRLGECDASTFSATPRSQLGADGVASQYEGRDEQNNRAVSPSRLNLTAERAPLFSRLNSPPTRRFRGDPSPPSSKQMSFGLEGYGVKTSSLGRVTPPVNENGSQPCKREDEDEETDIL